MHIKRIREMTECMTEYGKYMIEAGVNGKDVNIRDADKIVDIIKDLCQAEHSARLSKCLEKDEEAEKMGYRLSAAEYRKHAAEDLRSIDRHKGIMYYTETPKAEKLGEYDRAMCEHKRIMQQHSSGTPEDKQAAMKSAEAVLNIVFDDIDKMIECAGPELQSLVKARMMSRVQRMA